MATRQQAFTLYALAYSKQESWSCAEDALTLATALGAIDAGLGKTLASIDDVESRLCAAGVFPLADNVSALAAAEEDAALTRAGAAEVRRERDVARAQVRALQELDAAARGELQREKDRVRGVEADRDVAVGALSAVRAVLNARTAESAEAAARRLLFDLQAARFELQQAKEALEQARAKVDELGKNDSAYEEERRRASQRLLNLLPGAVATSGGWVDDAAAEEIKRLRSTIAGFEEEAFRLAADAQHGREQGAAEMRERAASLVWDRTAGGDLCALSLAARQALDGAIRVLPLSHEPQAPVAAGLSAEDAATLRGAGWTLESPGVWRDPSDGMTYDSAWPYALGRLQRYAAHYRAEKAPAAAHGEPERHTGEVTAAAGSSSVAEEAPPAQGADGVTYSTPGTVQTWVGGTPGSLCRCGVGAPARGDVVGVCKTCGGWRAIGAVRAPQGPTGGGEPEEKQCGGPREACAEPGCDECGTPDAPAEATPLEPTAADAVAGMLLRHRFAVEAADIASRGYQPAEVAGAMRERYFDTSDVRACIAALKALDRVELSRPRHASNLVAAIDRLTKARDEARQDVKRLERDVADRSEEVRRWCQRHNEMEAQRDEARAEAASEREYAARLKEERDAARDRAIDLEAERDRIQREREQQGARLHELESQGADEDEAPDSDRVTAYAVPSGVQVSWRRGLDPDLIATDVAWLAQAPGARPASSTQVLHSGPAGVRLVIAKGADPREVLATVAELLGLSTSDAETMPRVEAIRAADLLVQAERERQQATARGLAEKWDTRRDELFTEMSAAEAREDEVRKERYYGRRTELGERVRDLRAAFGLTPPDGGPGGGETPKRSEAQRTKEAPVSSPTSDVGGLDRDTALRLASDWATAATAAKLRNTYLGDGEAAGLQTAASELRVALGLEPAEIKVSIWRPTFNEPHGSQRLVGVAGVPMAHKEAAATVGTILDAVAPQDVGVACARCGSTRERAQELAERWRGRSKEPAMASPISATLAMCAFELSEAFGLDPEGVDHEPADIEPPSDPLEPYRAKASPEQRAACLHPPDDRMPLSGDGWLCGLCGADCAPPEALAEELTDEVFARLEKLVRITFDDAGRESAKILGAAVLALASEVKRLRAQPGAHSATRQIRAAAAYAVSGQAYGRSPELNREIAAELNVIAARIDRDEPSPEPTAAPDREALGREAHEAWREYARKEGLERPCSWEDLGSFNKGADCAAGERLFSMGVKHGRALSERSDARLSEIARLEDSGDLAAARALLEQVAADLGEDDSRVVAARWELRMSEGRGTSASTPQDGSCAIRSADTGLPAGEWKADASPSRWREGCWCVEIIDGASDGVVGATLFDGIHMEERARAYARWISGATPAIVSVETLRSLAAAWRKEAKTYRERGSAPANGRCDTMSASSVAVAVAFERAAADLFRAAGIEPPPSLPQGPSSPEDPQTTTADSAPQTPAQDGSSEPQAPRLSALAAKLSVLSAVLDPAAIADEDLPKGRLPTALKLAREADAMASALQVAAAYDSAAIASVKVGVDMAAGPSRAVAVVVKDGKPVATFEGLDCDKQASAWIDGLGKKLTAEPERVEVGVCSIPACARAGRVLALRDGPFCGGCGAKLIPVGEIVSPTGTDADWDMSSGVPVHLPHKAFGSFAAQPTTSAACQASAPHPPHGGQGLDGEGVDPAEALAGALGEALFQKALDSIDIPDERQDALRDDLRAVALSVLLRASPGPGVSSRARVAAKLNALDAILDESAADADLPRGRIPTARRLVAQLIELVDQSGPGGSEPPAPSPLPSTRPEVDAATRQHEAPGSVAQGAGDVNARWRGLEHEALPHSWNDRTWVVSADLAGEQLYTSFEGPDAEARAKEYAAFVSAAPEVKPGAAIASEIVQRWLNPRLNMQARILNAVAEVNEIALDDGLLCGVSGIEAIDRVVTHLREEAALRLQPSRLRAKPAR